MSAFGRVIALIGLILIGFGLFTPVLCPPTGCELPDHAFINSKDFEDDFIEGFIAGRSTQAMYIVAVSIVIVLSMIRGHRFAMFTASLMLFCIVAMYLIGDILFVTQEGANSHLGWGWSLLTVGGVMVIIAALPKSDLLLSEDDYDDDYYDDQPQPPYGSPQGMWQQPPSQQNPQHTMGGGWQQPPPQQQPQQPPMLPPPSQQMRASGMVSGVPGMYSTNQQPRRSSEYPTPQIQQQPNYANLPPPDPLRKTEPDLLNRERAKEESREMARHTVSARIRPSVPSPTLNQTNPVVQSFDRDATNEFAAPEPAGGAQSPAVMTGEIAAPSRQPRMVDESSQALMKTLISEESKTIVPGGFTQTPPPEDQMLDATEPVRDPAFNAIAREARSAQQSSGTRTPTPSIPAPRAEIADDQEVDLMKVTSHMRAPRRKEDDEVDLMRATSNMRPSDSPDSFKPHRTQSFGQATPPPVASDDRAAFLLNHMPADEVDNINNAVEQEPKSITKDMRHTKLEPVPPEQRERPTQSFTFNQSEPSPLEDRASFLLTTADQEIEDNASIVDFGDDVVEQDEEFMEPEIEDSISEPEPEPDDSLPFGVPILEDEVEIEVEDEFIAPVVEPEDSQPYGVPMLEEDDDDDDEYYDPEEENDTDPELRDKFDEYAEAFLKENKEEDTGPYGVPVLEKDQDDDKDFQTTIEPVSLEEDDDDENDFRTVISPD